MTLLGLGRSHAVYRGGLGCYLDHGGAVADIALPADASRRDAAARHRRTIGRRAAEPAARRRARSRLRRTRAPPFRRTRAVVVMKDGRVVAERYAEGIGIDTPLLGFSATKSVISALTGILVRQGRLKLDQPAPVAAWRNPDDPGTRSRSIICCATPPALKLGSSLQASLGAALEPVNRMKFMETDMAALRKHAARDARRARAWNYHDGNTFILSK